MQNKKNERFYNFIEFMFNPLNPLFVFSPIIIIILFIYYLFNKNYDWKKRK